MSAFLGIPTLTLDGNATAISGFPTSGTTTNTIIELGKKFTGIGLQFLTSTGLNVKYYVSYNGYDAVPLWTPIESTDGLGAPTAANVADVIAAGDITYFNCAGATHIRVTRTAGSGTFTGSAFDGLSPVELAVYDSTGKQYVNQVGADTANNLAKVQTKSAIGSGGRLTANGDAHVGACTLLGLICSATTAGTVTVSDNSGSAGTALFSVIVPINTTTYLPLPGVAFGTGVRVDLTTFAGSVTAIVGPAVN